MFFLKTLPSWIACGLLLGPTYVAGACEGIQTWNDLVRLANAAMRERQDELCLKPFHIMKPQDVQLVLNRPISMRCEKQSESDECKIEGAGNHIQIAGGNALAMISGFTFVGATECAIRLFSTSRKTHQLIECAFIDNHGSFDGWRGGAIKTELETSMEISDCTFEGNSAAGGGAIFHRGTHMLVANCSFANNIAKEGGAIKIDASATSEIYEVIFSNNLATKTKGGAIEVTKATTLTYDLLSGYGNSPCNGVYDRSNNICHALGEAPVIPSFDLGKLQVNALGLKLSYGLSVRIIARAGQKVTLTSPERPADQSTLLFHTNPDGAAVFKLENGDWIYLSNAENTNAQGGVYGVIFDSKGRPKDYVERLKGTTRNCAGGATPFNTWVSCEEFGLGQCWQVDPAGKMNPAKTRLVEPEGGNFEAMTYDITDPDQPYFFVTEDHERGAIRRFKPSCMNIGLSWNLLHLPGEIDYLMFHADGTFEWTPDLSLGRDSAQSFYPNVEGISFDDGVLSFVAKTQKEIFRLDLAKGTWKVESTNRGSLPGGGRFGAEPDQLIQNGDYLYFTEDGGGNPGIYVTDGTSFYTVFEARDQKFNGDETTGLSFSPDGTRLYVCIQEIGYFFEITRDDGLPFPGHNSVSRLRWHNKEPKPEN